MHKLTSIILFVLFLCGNCLLWSNNALADGDTCKQPGSYNQKGEIPSGAGIVPNSVISNIYLVNYAADEKISDLLVLGDALWCYAKRYGAKDITIGQTVLFAVPNFSILISGICLWIIGVLLVFVIAYYLVDLSFKLAFAVMAMPIAIALWPFPPTKKKLSAVISLMLNCTGVFIFLSLGITYAIALIKAAYRAAGGFDTVYEYINNGETEPLKELFDVVSTNFLLMAFAGFYGFKLVGSMVNEYAKQFFSDDTGMGATPMHDKLTQLTDFAKKQAAKPFKKAKDIASTQTKRGLMKGYGAIGNKLAGSNNRFVKGLGSAMNNVASDYEGRYQNQGTGEAER